MDPLTHALSGAVAARAALRDRTSANALPMRAQLWAGFAAAAFPDIDIVLRVFGTLAYLNWHQGITHSLIMLPLWAWLLAQLFARFYGRPNLWRRFLPAVTLGLAAHIIGDLITAYGTMLFAPLSNARFSLPLVFVVDPAVTLLLAVGLTLSLRASSGGRAIAIASLLLVGAYLMLNVTIRENAIDIAERRADTIGWHEARITVLPQPFSPWHRTLMLRHEDDYEVAQLRLSTLPSPTARLRAALGMDYAADTETSWQRQPAFGNTSDEVAFARQAWSQRVFTPFRRFAHLPFLHEIETAEARRCAWFADQRFVVPGLPPSFRFGACEHNDGHWTIERQRGLFIID